MKVFDRFNTAILVSAGLCGAALAFSPSAAAAPLSMPTGGPTCIEQMAGLGAVPAAVPAVLPGPVAGAVPSVPVVPSGGFPPVVPPGGFPPVVPPGGFLPVVPPGGFPPVVPPGGFPPVVPPGVAPAVGPLLAEDSAALGSGILAGKGVPTASPQAALSGLVVLPGPPASVEAPPAAAPVVAAATPLLCCGEAAPPVR
ncbi:hypothetical protein JK2ML_0568 [Mycobacterium leprae Kyoto-2]|uniref:Uncharacterized protein n=3 Tax=Mycobacterium leprae TaxID=1769 RepID=Q9CCN7_MYCLE|nr:hypothetical protein [Mycobacterium leprae]CAR70661.1 hypothetical protein MLBr00568 [Mycobacterium leprae Br4923]AWV47438.1 hypothetical protein DIJ64_03065 [Mycobacterium leprae]OAR20188.1 hypothetical protein A8144_02690 [Mycobacterium leprae 3125609]OAX71635.1 hypothetical protein A3216_04280 [Mycobacterium leprae 7935681]CAC30076.1 hypothetical protein [Mycobacterium leprae]